MRYKYCTECGGRLPDNCTCQTDEPDDITRLEDGLDLLSQSDDDEGDIPDRRMVTNQNPIEDDTE